MENVGRNAIFGVQLRYGKVQDTEGNRKMLSKKQKAVASAIL